MNEKDVRWIDIDSLPDFEEQVDIMCSSCPRGPCDKSWTHLYRGQAGFGWQLLPSIARHDNEFRSDGYYPRLNLETNLIEAVKYRYPAIFQDGFSPMELLALMQHHGVPTRLLDVTENPLVSLYFACKGSPRENGEIVVFRIRDREIGNPAIVKVIADSYRIIGDLSLMLLTNSYEVVSEQDYFRGEKYRLGIKDTEDGAQWIEECCSRFAPFFVRAPIRTKRQEAQSGRYILFSNKIKRCGEIAAFVSEIEEIKYEDECVVSLFRISSSRKASILEELAGRGIREETLFPKEEDDPDIDEVCKQICANIAEKQDASAWMGKSDY